MTTKPLKELRSLIERSREQQALQQQQQQAARNGGRPTPERDFSPDPSSKLADYFAGLEESPTSRRSAPRRTPEVRRHTRRSPDADGASPASTPSHEDAGSEPPGSLETLRSDGVASEASDDFDDGFDFGGKGGVEALRARLRGDDADEFHDEDDEFQDENDFRDEDEHFDSDERFSNGSFSDGSGDEYVEEDFRYARPLDFTLTTIIEESCEDSDSDRSSTHSGTPTGNNPSNFEKYFLFDLGNGPHDPKKYANEESEYSDTFSETNDSIYSEFVEGEDADVDPVEQASSRYFMKGFLGFNRQPSIRSAADDSENQTDGSGSVGSDSECAPSPEQRRKKVPRSRARAQSDVGGSGGEVSAREASEQSGDTTSGEDATADAPDEGPHEKGDGQDTMKRKKKRKLMVTGEQSDRETGEKAPRQDDVFASPAPKASSEPPQSTRPNGVVSHFIQISKTGEAHQSRDSGFLGSSDDLLKESVIREAEERSEGGGARGSSDSSLSDEAGSKAPAASAGGSQRTPDSSEETAKKSTLVTTKTLTGPARPPPPNGLKTRNKVSRKDSFNNWSSDEETNILMSRLRHFFRTTISNAQRSDPNTPQSKPSPFVLFESELTRLMKTVPGINDAQVREIVEYLSSEDTWSDSYDSSDYTSSDLEGAYGALNPAQPDIMTQIQQQISHSCQQIIQRYDPADTSGASAAGQVASTVDPAAKDSLAAYEKLMGSLKGLSEAPVEPPPASPPMLAKVMHHIGSRLVALMQEVSSGAETGSLGENSPAKSARFPPMSQVLSKTAADTSSFQRPVRRGLSTTGDATRISQREAELNRILRESKRRKKKEFDSSQSLVESSAADDKWARLSGRVRSEGDVSVRSSGSGSTLTIGQPGSECSSSEQVDSDSTVRAAPRSARLLPRSLSARVPDADGQRSTLPRSTPAGPPDNPTGSLSLPRRAAAAPMMGVASLTESGRSARYRPPGYRPTTRRAQSARMAPRLPLAATDDRMPGSPQPGQSPLVSRSPSVVSSHQRRSVASLPTSEPDEESERTVSSSQQGTPTLGSRSGSLVSVCSAGEVRYGTVAVRGDVQLAVRYLPADAALEVTVHQCRNLAAADARRNKSDPYVKVYLLPDRSKSGKRKTKTKKHTLNPVFEEILKFPAALTELGSRTLWVTVWHSDMFGRNDFLGEVLLPLASIALDDSTAADSWHPLQERSELHEEGGSGRGDVIIALKYAPPEEGLGSRRARRSRGALHVMVKEAKHLVAVRSNGSADPFCKCYLLPDRKGSKQKTSVVRRTTSPRWTGTLLFSDVTLAELKERALELTVWDHSLTSSELLGGARFNNGSGQHQGKPAHWMDAEGAEASLWEQMLDRPGFWVEGSVPLRASLESGSAAIK